MKKLLKFTFWLFLLTVLPLAAAGAYLWYIWSSNLPVIGAVKDYQPPVVTEVLSTNGEVIGRFYDENRSLIKIEEVPYYVIMAFVAAEDASFFEHIGLDFKGITRAFFKNLFAGEIKQGGSTITQQVTKSILLENTKRTYRRKVREMILSVQLEKNFSKEQILYLYLNQIYLGQGSYGIEAAAQTYFNKSIKDADIAEAALLAALPQAPSRYSPVTYFDRASNRQKYVLARMREEGFITNEQLMIALKKNIKIQPKPENPFKKAPYFTEYVRQYLINKYGRDIVYRDGLRVYTTIDLKTQDSARRAVKRGLLELDKREGYRGPMDHLSPEQAPNFMLKAREKYTENPPEIDSIVEALVEKVDDEAEAVTVRMGPYTGTLHLADMKWAREPDKETAYYSVRVRKPSEVLKTGDIIFVQIIKEGLSKNSYLVSLNQEPDIQGALVSLSPHTGEVKAIIGGWDYAASQFNRAVQSRRQPGSAFKPIIYAAALDKGMTPVTVIMDSPFISEKNSNQEAWKPKNYKGKFFGPTLFRTGLAESRNIITIKILKNIGVKYAIEYARKMGIESALSPDLSLALGSSGVSLMELACSYAVFSNGGKLVKPIFVKRILDRHGRVIEENQPEIKDVISTETAFVMTDLLKTVVQDGTAWRIKALRRPAAGKTGTTNNLWDAWFMGYTPELVTGVWVGYDDRKEMGKGETGSRAASPIWLYFMKDVLKGRPVVDFDAPKGIVFVKIDTETGFLASPYSKITVFQAFKAGEEPQECSPKTTPYKSNQFFEFDMDYK